MIAGIKKRLVNRINALRGARRKRQKCTRLCRLSRSGKIEYFDVEKLSEMAYARRAARY